VNYARGAAGRAVSDAWEEFDSGAYARVADVYPKVKLDGRWWLPDGGLRAFTQEELISYLREVSELDSSPGLPWISDGCKEVRDVLERFPSELYQRVRDRLLARLSWLNSDGELSELNGVGVVAYNLRDPTRIFVKNEVHSKEKISSGRVRLIMNVSFTDIVIERLLGDATATTEVAQFTRHPSCTGMGLSDQGGAAISRMIFRPTRAGARPRGGDVSAFDWSVSEGALKAAALVENLQCGQPPESIYAQLNLQQARLTARKLFVLADGTVCEARGVGVQESGSRRTHCYNSKIRYLASSLFLGNEECITNGDDDVEWLTDSEVSAAPALYRERTGWKVEFPEFPDGAVEFCSTKWFPDGRFYPTSWPKSLYRLLSHAPNWELYSQFAYEMRHLPERDELLSFVRRVWDL
jgi:hypothetical protein